MHSRFAGAEIKQKDFLFVIAFELWHHGSLYWTGKKGAHWEKNKLTGENIFVPFKSSLQFGFKKTQWCRQGKNSSIIHRVADWKDFWTAAF